MNDWNDIVNNLSNEEEEKQKLLEEAAKEAAAKAKILEKERKAALAKIEVLKAEADKAIAEAQEIADKHGLDFNVYGPDGTSFYYKSKVEKTTTESDEDWESSDEGEDGYRVGWSSSSDYC